jgi:hypothetical protein
MGSVGGRETSPKYSSAEGLAVTRVTVSGDLHRLCRLPEKSALTSLMFRSIFETSDNSRHQFSRRSSKKHPKLHFVSAFALEVTFVLG